MLYLWPPMPSGCVIPLGQSLLRPGRYWVSTQAHTCMGCLFLRDLVVQDHQPATENVSWNSSIDCGHVSSPGTRAIPEALLANRPGDGGFGDFCNVSFYQSSTKHQQKCVYYPVLHSVKWVWHHAMLLEVGVVLVKAIHFSPTLMLIWVTSETHSHRDLHSLWRRVGVPQTSFRSKTDGDKTWVCPTNTEVSSRLWCLGVYKIYHR